MITPKARISNCQLIIKQDIIKDSVRMDEFIECWVHTFSPHHSKSNNPIIISSLVLHFILFHGLQNTSFVKFLVNSKKVIFHPVYQKAIFDEIAVGVPTDFTSRVEGQTNNARDLEILVDYLLLIANSDINEFYTGLCSYERFGFVAGGRDVHTSFNSFKSLVGSLNKDSTDEMISGLLKINNRVVSNLDGVTGRHTSLDVLTESYNNHYKAQLGVYKFRNIDEDIYAIQDRG
jgi:hypothetical protein